jgi:APA family basic amino acid/polyamine antiporter
MKTHHPEFQLPFGYSTASAVVIASMIGTGVFTTLGLEAQELKTGFSLMLLWLVGGLLALAGALSYGELAAAMPRSGGEYHFLGKIYHPVLGIVAGWISVTIGFAAPSALAAMAFSRYASAFADVPTTSLAVLVLVGVTAFHAFSVTIGKRFHMLTTAAKYFSSWVSASVDCWLFRHLTLP